MLKNNIIFIGGVHGVGKSTLCKKISTELSIKHFSSSELISMVDSSKVRTDKKANDIKGNQNLLLEAKKLFLNEDRIYLLDGHFCLIDDKYLIKKIPMNLYESLGIRGIIILTDDDGMILKRINYRDGYNSMYSLEFIRDFQQKEISYGKLIADKIKVPLRIINLSNDEEDVVTIIRDFT
ncbi:MAG: AAA family ATPase [Clostridiales bacterium]|nr:AAA family ATPase [Clostridiales bacterium]